ncbi:MAG TPA: GNAT family N-acetyltransferase [Thermoproteota archaeon]|nr:GNAT family N-acetyltransferase [Thermoproteota archaeon]
MVSHESFRSKVVLNQGYDADLCLVAEEREDIVGFIFGVMQERTGYLNAIFVKEEHRRRGIGTAMFDAFSVAIRSKGGAILSVSWGPGAITPGVDRAAYPEAFEFFTKMGFKEFETSIAMSRSLMNYKTPDEIKALESRLREEGFVFQQLDEEHVLDLVQFLKRELPGWENDARGTMLRHPKDLDYLFVALKDDKVVGYCQMGIDGSIEHFGPFAVAEVLRSKGIGAVLFHGCLQAMQAKGARNMWFMRSVGRSQSFYFRHGLKEMRRFTALSRDL